MKCVYISHTKRLFSLKYILFKGGEVRGLRMGKGCCQKSSLLLHSVMIDRSEMQQSDWLIENNVRVVLMYNL